MVYLSKTSEVLEYYKENKQLYLIMTIWLIAGSLSTFFSYILIPLTAILMYKKNMFEELLIGYVFILLISDSLYDNFEFAKSVKNFYICILAFIFFKDTSKFPENSLFKLFLPFFVFSFVIMFLSISEPFFFTSFQKTLSYMLTFLVIPSFIQKIYLENGSGFIKRILFFALTTLLLGLLLKFIAPSIANLESGRFRGVLGNPNGIGIYCVLIYISFFVVKYYFPDMFTKQESRLFIFAILISIILSDSRNSIIAIILFFVFQRFFSYSPYLGFVLFIITMIIFQVINDNIVWIVQSLGLSDVFRLNTLATGSGRYVAWKFAWKQIQHNFFIGKGFGYNEYYMRSNYAILGKMGHQGGIHNSFLTFWMDQGLIGLLIFIRSFILLFIKASKKVKFAFPIMFAISFTAVFESWLVGSLSVFAFCAVFIYTLISSDKILPVSEIKGTLEVEPQQSIQTV